MVKKKKKLEKRRKKNKWIFFRARPSVSHRCGRITHSSRVTSGCCILLTPRQRAGGTISIRQLPQSSGTGSDDSSHTSTQQAAAWCMCLPCLRGAPEYRRDEESVSQRRQRRPDDLQLACAFAYLPPPRTQIVQLGPPHWEQRTQKNIWLAIYLLSQWAAAKVTWMGRHSLE